MIGLHVKPRFRRTSNPGPVSKLVATLPSDEIWTHFSSCCFGFNRVCVAAHVLPGTIPWLAHENKVCIVHQWCTWTTLARVTIKTVQGFGSWLFNLVFKFQIGLDVKCLVSAYRTCRWAEQAICGRPAQESDDRVPSTPLVQEVKVLCWLVGWLALLEHRRVTSGRKPLCSFGVQAYRKFCV